MTTHSSLLHPSCLPTLSLLSLLSLSSSDLLPQPLDALIELSLTAIYESGSTRPLSLSQWLLRIFQLEPRIESGKVGKVVQDKMMNLLEGGLDEVQGWFNDLKSLYPIADEEETPVNPTRLHRTSPYSLYIRRCRLTYSSLSFDEAVTWWDAVTKWCLDVPSSSNEEWNEGKSRKEKMGEVWRRGKKGEDWMMMWDGKGVHDFDETDRGGVNIGANKTHNALLHTAYMEYETGGLEASRAALTEAIQVARRLGDSKCLSSCASLSKRLDFALLSSSSSSTNSITSPPTQTLLSNQQTPTDVLWEIKRLSSLASPPTSLLPLLYSSKSMYQTPSTSTLTKGIGNNWNDKDWEANWFASSGRIWDQLGSSTLRDVNEKISLDFLDSHSINWSTKLPILAHRANRLATSQQSETALQLLFNTVSNSKKRRGMGIGEFKTWERIVWEVLLVRVQDLGLKNLSDHILKTSPTPLPHLSIPLTSSPSLSASHSYSLGLSLLSQPLLSIPHFLSSLRLSTLHHLHPLRTLSLFRVIELRLSLSPTVEEARRGMKELEEEWGQVLRGGEEVRGEGRVLRSRLGVVEGFRGKEEVKEAVRECEEVRGEYRKMELPSKKVLGVLLLLVKFYDTLLQLSFDTSSTTTSREREREELVLKRSKVMTEYREIKKRSKEVEEGEWKRVVDVGELVRSVERVVLAELGRSG